MTFSLDTASSLLWWSNVIYVVGAVLTLGTSALVLFEKRQIGKGIEIRHSVRNEVFFVTSAVICLAGTCGAIYFSNRVSDIKDADLTTYKTQAGVQIAQAKQDAATANQNAGIANKSAADASLKNTQLQIALANHETNENKIETQLTAQNKATSDFAHGLAQQQATMAEQARVSPALSPYQIQDLAQKLSPFAGQKVAIYSTSDTVVLRLAAQIKQALSTARIDNSQGAIMMGALYQGVSVGVRDAQNVPPLANALVVDLRSVGIDVHPVSDPKFVQDGYVDIFVGPN